MSVFLLSEHGAKVSCEVLFGLGLCGYLESLSPVVDRWAGNDIIDTLTNHSTENI